MADRLAADHGPGEGGTTRISVCYAALQAGDDRSSAVSDILTAAFAPDEIASVEDPAQATGPVLFPLEAPAADLARHLQEGTAPAAALADWVRRTQASLTLLRGHRRRLVLVALDALCAADPTCLEALSPRLKLELRADVPTSAPVLAAPLYLLLARELLASDPEAQALAEELHAMMTGGPGMAPTGLDAVTLIWSRDRQRQDALAEATQAGARLQTDLSRLNRDRKVAEDELDRLRERSAEEVEQVSLLRDTLAQTVQLIEDLEIRLTSREAELDELRQAAGGQSDLLMGQEQQLKAAKKARAEQAHAAEQRHAALAEQGKQLEADLQAQLDALTEERDLLALSLQEALGQATAQERDNTDLRERVGDEKLLKAVNRAQDRRFQTALVERRLREEVLGRIILDTGEQLRTQQAETRQVRSDLDLRNEALAATEIRLADREKALKRAETRLADLDKALKAAATRHKAQTKTAEELTRTLAERTRGLAEASARIEDLSAELDRIYTSNSWKVTDPLRKARSRIPGSKP